MPRIQFVAYNGTVSLIDVPTGTSLMSAAVSNGIDGIVGECGGSGMCATCHVYIAEKFVDSFPKCSEIENEMLESASSERRPTSRLGCQVLVSDEHEGLVAHLPESQF